MRWLRGAFTVARGWLGSVSIELYVVAALLLFGVGFGCGVRWSEGSAAKEQLRQQKVVLRAYADAIVRGQTDVARLQTNLKASTTYANTLKERLRHAQLIAQPPAPSASANDAAGADVASTAGPVLSAAAVSLWNSALAGADVPTGACRSADPADPACAAAAGLTVDDAWANHAENAASCRADRIRYQQLIDHLNHRPTESTGSTP